MRVGGPPSSPFIIMSPEKACTIGSKPGFSLSGPVLPNAHTEQ
jgi:hypothetical protein